MKPIPRLSILLVFSLWLGLAPFVTAQSAPFRYELLSLLPDDFAVCVVMHDLQGHHARWEKSAWFKTFRASPLGKTILDMPELKQLDKWQSKMKMHFDLDWPTLRDDLLGDTLILAYSPGVKNQPDDEHGLFLLHVRKPERLVQFIDRLNEAQEKSGDLKSLTALAYKGSTYQRREEKGKTQYYFIDGPLAAVTAKEEMLKAFLDKRTAATKDSAWAKRFQRAGAEEAIVTMCVNPRNIEPEFGSNLKKSEAFPGYWRALDGIFVTLTIRDEAEVRISIQAQTDQLPRWAKAAFAETAAPSLLWQRFPEQSILAIASKLDFAGTVEGLKLLLAEKDRTHLVEIARRAVAPMLELDPFDDILPNIGPDWGVCVLPPKDANQLPGLIVAVAVKPGSKKQPVDQKLYWAAQTFAGIAVLDYNNKNPDTIRMQTVMQGPVEVKFLTSEKFFPQGVQPACALKDGFLIFASSPEAIADFRPWEAKAGPARETPLVRLSTRELARLIDHRRDYILGRMTEKDAKQNLENVIAILGLFERVTLSQTGGDGQASWTIRLFPALR